MRLNFGEFVKWVEQFDRGDGFLDEEKYYQALNNRVIDYGYWEDKYQLQIFLRRVEKRYGYYE